MYIHQVFHELAAGKPGNVYFASFVFNISGKTETMKHVEIIELRSSSRDNDLLKMELSRIMDETANANDLQGVSIDLYENQMVSTDFSIHLIHKSGRVDSTGSPLGLHICSALKAFGLINHKLWIEMETRHSILRN